MRRSTLIAAAVALFMLAAPAAAQAFPPYTATPLLGPGLTSSEAASVNDAGLIVGSATLLPGQTTPTGFEWNPGVLAPTAVSPPASPAFSSASADVVNDNGDVAGVDVVGGECQGWDRIGGVSRSLGAVSPTGISDAGIVVGLQVDAACETTGGFYSTNGHTIHSLGEDVWGINELNVAVGLDSNGRGAYWQLSTSSAPVHHLIPLPPGALGAPPFAISQAGDITGGGGSGGFLYHVGDSASVTVSYPAGEEPLQMNNSDVTTMTGEDGIYDIFDQFELPATPASMLGAGTPYTRLFIVGINDHGELVGMERPDNAAVMLFPNPPVFHPGGEPTPGGPHIGPIPELLNTPELPVTLTFKPSAPAGVPIAEIQAQVSSDGGASWQGLKLAKPTAHTVTFNSKPGTQYLVRASATDSLSVQSKWSSSQPFTPTITDDSDQTLSYAGNWTPFADSRAIGGDLTSTSEQGDSVSWSFTGTQVGVIGRVGPQQGSGELFVDGTDEGALNFTAPKTKERDVIAGVSLKPGTHTVKLVSQGGGPIVFDGFTSIQ